MPRKHFVLSDKDITIIQKAMQEQGLASENAALRYILNTYNKRSDISNTIQGKMADSLEVLQKSVEQTELNSKIIIEALNTMLVENGSAVLYSTKAYPSRVMTTALEELKREKGE